MFEPIGPINPGQTLNIWDKNSQTLTQIQHNRDHVDIVTHLDKGFDPVPAHIVTRIDRHGNLETNY